MAATLHFTLQPAPHPLSCRRFLLFAAFLACQFRLIVRGTKTPGLDRARSRMMNIPQWQKTRAPNSTRRHRISYAEISGVPAPRNYVRWQEMQEVHIVRPRQPWQVRVNCSHSGPQHKRTRRLINDGASVSITCFWAVARVMHHASTVQKHYHTSRAARGNVAVPGWRWTPPPSPGCRHQPLTLALTAMLRKILQKHNYTDYREQQEQ